MSYVDAERFPTWHELIPLLACWPRLAGDLSVLLQVGWLIADWPLNQVSKYSDLYFLHHTNILYIALDF